MTIKDNRDIVNDNIFHLEADMTPIERKVIAALRQHGYKLTPQRREVIRTIASSHGHLTPTAIYEKVHQEYPSIGFVTIYRTLEILDRLGLICEVHSGGACQSYLVRRPSEHHHHQL